MLEFKTSSIYLAHNSVGQLSGVPGLGWFDWSSLGSLKHLSSPGRWASSWIMKDSCAPTSGRWPAVVQADRGDYTFCHSLFSRLVQAHQVSPDEWARVLGAAIKYMFQCPSFPPKTPSHKTIAQYHNQDINTDTIKTGLLITTRVTYCSFHSHVSCSPAPDSSLTLHGYWSVFHFDHLVLSRMLYK